MFRNHHRRWFHRSGSTTEEYGGDLGENSQQRFVTRQRMEQGYGLEHLKLSRTPHWLTIEPLIRCDRGSQALLNFPLRINSSEPEPTRVKSKRSSLEPSSSSSSLKGSGLPKRRKKVINSLPVAKARFGMAVVNGIEALEVFTHIVNPDNSPSP